MNRTFFITSVTAQRRTLFQRDVTADLFVEVLLHYRSHGKYLLHEFVVMPDHFHVLITPSDEISLEKSVQFIKGGFSFRLNSKLPVWQPSFTNHRIRDEEDFEGHREYIWMNPVASAIGEQTGGISIFVCKREVCSRPDAAGAKARFHCKRNAGLKAGSSTKTTTVAIRRRVPHVSRFSIRGIPAAVLRSS